MQEVAAAQALADTDRGRAVSVRATTAPMPGRIVRVMVAIGDAVEVDTPLVIVEAMKMENELRSTIAGTVTALPTREGDTVDPGQVLCEVTPHAASE